LRRRLRGEVVVGMGLAGAVACVARMPRGIVLFSLAWALVPSASATPAPASAATSAAGSILSVCLAIGEGGLLAQSGRNLDRLIGELFARLLWLIALPCL
jgi:hypothetical protein